MPECVISAACFEDEFVFDDEGNEDISGMNDDLLADPNYGSKLPESFAVDGVPKEDVVPEAADSSSTDKCLSKSQQIKLVKNNRNKGLEYNSQKSNKLMPSRRCLKPKCTSK